MTLPIVIMINTIGVIISLFGIYVCIDLLKKHRLSRFIFFILTSIGILIWNIGHLVHNLLNKSSNNIARITWLIILIGGFIFIISSIIGFSLLRNESIQWRMIFYDAVFSMLLTSFFLKPEWMNLYYSKDEGWIVDPTNLIFWYTFSISISIFAFLELQYPLLQAFKNDRLNRWQIFILIFSITLALVSNLIIPLLVYLNLPIAISYLIADSGFLLFFYFLLKNPFVGIYDPVIVNEVIVTNEFQEAIFTRTTDEGKAILASGAILGINMVLERINLLDENIPLLWENEFRRIELSFTKYFIAIQQKYVIIINYSNATGVCIQKFKVLSKIFLDTKSSIEQKLLVFEEGLQLYFPTMQIERNSNFLEQ